MSRNSPSSTVDERYQLENPKPPDKAIPRRFPRLGSQFQSKIGKSTEPLDRPPPDRMSAKYPHLTEGEVKKQNAQSNPTESTCVEILFHSQFESTCLNDTRIERGGVLMNAPVRDMAQYTTFIQPLVTSFKSHPQSLMTNHGWVQHMIHLHSSQVSGRRRRNSRGRVKGKQKSDNELVWSLESMLESHQSSRKRKKSYGATSGEDEAHALSYLSRQCCNSVRAASFKLLVGLSGGQALKMRRCGERQRFKLHGKSPSVIGSESWRIVYERMAFPFYSSILGQMQDDEWTQYTHDASGSSTLSLPSSKIGKEGNPFADVTLDIDDLKGAWRSILTCAKSIERQLCGEDTEGKKPLMSTLLAFVGNAYKLPLPESCFGTHHVIIEEVANSMLLLLEHIEKAQKVQAEIRDKIFNESLEGIDSDALLKFLDFECDSLTIKLSETEELYRYRNIVVDWETRVLFLLEQKNEDGNEPIAHVPLEDVEALFQEAKSHGYRSRVFVQLMNRIEKVRSLRGRILEWNLCLKMGERGSLKTLTSILKEINRIKLSFAEAEEMLHLLQICDKWTDRANIAIRSKLSLSEIQALISAANHIPLDLSDYLEKLNARVRSAEQWLEALEELVPYKRGCRTRLEWMERLRCALQGGNQVCLHELLSEGSRIPVELDEAKLLQVAFDAKNWTAKSWKWLPNAPDSRKGKLSELRDHLQKVSALRNVLPLSELEKTAWSPEGEKELSDIVHNADSWLEKYHGYVCDDRHNGECHQTLSVKQIREISEEGNRIYANMGSAASKFSKILSQADHWYKAHLALLHQCRVIEEPLVREEAPFSFIDVSELESAVEDASNTISVEIDEAAKLRTVLEKVKRWRQQVALIAPKRSKRNVRSLQRKLNFSDLKFLIAESERLPIDTKDDVERLKMQLSIVETWRSEAACELECIVDGFKRLQAHVSVVYNEANQFKVEFYPEEISIKQDMMVNWPTTSDALDARDAEVNSVSDADGEDLMTGSGSSVDVFRRIKKLHEGSKDVCVVTSEGKIIDLLETVATWSIRSLKYLSSPREIFEKRYFGSYDRFLEEGEELCSKAGQTLESDFESVEAMMCSSWGQFVSDQLIRLNVLKKEREYFKDWCRAANTVLAHKKKLNPEKLSDLVEKSRRFPATNDLISKVRGRWTRTEKWVKETRHLLVSGKRMSLQDAKILLENGEKLQVNLPELHSLKSKLDLAQNWLKKVGNCTNGQGAKAKAVDQLIDEYDDLLVEFPEELEDLQQANVGYCLCRRPYEGFMIGCDHCEEWYHGPCIGVSESKAERYEKFMCIRCATRNIFETSASEAIGLIRKWTCTKDLRKARQVVYQKIQRKFRKETKDVEKYTGIYNEAKQLITKTTPKSIGDGTMFVSTSECALSALSNISKGESAVKDGEMENKGDQRSEYFSQLHPQKSIQQKITKSPSDLASNSDRVKAMASSASKIQGSEGNVLHFGSLVEAPQHTDLLASSSTYNVLMEAQKKVTQAKQRLEAVSSQSLNRKVVEEKENELATILRRWVLMVRDHVLVPSDPTKSERARPTFGMLFSDPMKEVIEQARFMGISDLPDIKQMENHFKCMSWSLHALALLRRKPTLSDVDYLIACAEGLKLPDERALRTMKFMSARANQCQKNMLKVLNVPPDEGKLINVSSLDEILSCAEDLPVCIPVTKAFESARKDVSAGQSISGRFDANRIPAAFPSSPLTDPSFDRHSGVSEHAPDPMMLWPPFGLLGSKSAIKALGLECSAIIPDVNNEDKANRPNNDGP